MCTLLMLLQATGDHETTCVIECVGVCAQPKAVTIDTSMLLHIIAQCKVLYTPLCVCMSG